MFRPLLHSRRQTEGTSNAFRFCRFYALAQRKERAANRMSRLTCPAFIH
jgi:hypothetical protein